MRTARIVRKLLLLLQRTAIVTMAVSVAASLMFISGVAERFFMGNDNMQESIWKMCVGGGFLIMCVMIFQALGFFQNNTLMVKVIKRYLEIKRERRRKRERKGEPKYGTD